MMRHKLLNHLAALFLGLMLTLSPPAFADPASDAKIEALQKKLDHSLKMIEALTARVKELEQQQAAQARAAANSNPSAVARNTPPAAPPTAAPAPAPAAQDQQRIEAVEQKVAQIETANATRQQDDTGLPIHGFADVNLGNHNLYFPYFHGFNVGSLDFYLTPKLGDRVVSLAELIFETGPDGVVGTDLERFQIGYQFNDQATVWVGRFHTPYGYVNTALHHGVWLADALRRPKFANFEDKGGVMPAHTTGVWLTGAMREDNGKFLYDFYTGNGQHIQGGIVDMQNGGNLHGAAMFGSRLSYQLIGGGADGLLVGGNGFTDKGKDDNPLTPALLRLHMGG